MNHTLTVGAIGGLIGVWWLGGHGVCWCFVYVPVGGVPYSQAEGQAGRVETRAEVNRAMRCECVVYRSGAASGHSYRHVGSLGEAWVRVPLRIGVVGHGG